MMRHMKGNNGELRQAGWRVAEIGDWWYRGGAMRAEYLGAFVMPENESAPMQVTLCNGDEPIVHGKFYVNGDICEQAGLLRLILLPAILLGDDLRPE